MKIAVVKYNAGNIYSVDYALKRLGVEATITSDKEVLMSADKVIFPGVGEAETTMSHLRKNRLDEVIKNLKQPVLGICLGMQLLFDWSSEVRKTDGLGFVSGQVELIETDLKLPHIGWNSLQFPNPSPLFSGLDEGCYVYFVHSFCGSAARQENVIATTDYGGEVLAAVQSGNVFGTQFHPEKSGDVGMQILKNFGLITMVFRMIILADGIILALVLL